ncbi:MULTISPECIES: restriction endonuclease subunit S [unclassified Sphingobacterium]|uniref:restriction endonuclease subunit S n=1 Tax=unclassified Sphingobacterium TaxID=2609468 RepID=UPI0025F01354|nr:MULTISPECIES: restriction endonuclease subunit S [unclassified Sphingobacterium]
MKIVLNKVLTPISGDWGVDDLEGNGVNVIRTANFRNDGKIDYNNIVKRLFQKKTIDENGRERYVLDSEKIAEKKLLNNDIIIEKSGGGPETPVGRVVYFENPGKEVYMANNFTQVLRANPDKVIPKYLFYYLRYLYLKGVVYKYQNQTTGLANLKLEKYLKEEILIPDFDKQNIVVTQLNIIQHNIDLRKSSIEILSNLIHSVYFKMFGDPVNNQKGFPRKKLSQVTPKDKIITYGIVQAGPHIDDGIPYIRTGDIKNGKIVSKNLLRTTPEIAKKHDRSKCIEGDIIVSIRATVGQSAVIPKDLDGANLTQGTARISPNTTVINPNYLFVTLQSEGFQFLINKYVKGSTFKEITLEKLRNIEIPVPKDLNLQNRFSQIYESIQDVESKVKQSLEILQQLFQVILQNAFKPDVGIDEEPIFKDLIKKFTVQDLKGNKQRLQYLINLFEQQNFDEFKDFTETRKILFELMDEEEIIQTFGTDNKVKLQVK